MPGKIQWLASYPKSGNTWLRMLLANYYSETEQPHDINKPGVSEGIASSRWLFDNFLGTSSADLTVDEVLALQPHVFELLAESGDRNHWMKVHDAQSRLPDGRWLFPPEVSAGAIYIVRNPLDVAVSRAFHEGHGDMERAVEAICDKDRKLAGAGKTQLNQFLGDWSHHVASWTGQDAIPVLLVRYEDMLADTASELKRVLAFARPEEEIDIARIRRAVRHASFETLRAEEERTGFRETGARQDRFFRSGTAGDWINHLSPGQAERVLRAHGVMMARLGYDAGNPTQGHRPSGTAIC